ncbi:hypothetical protein ABIF65_006611 [Bradyrhizobium japonicum]|nr:hypothetical protein [Bradyrhizobium japonicum]MCP1783242.1 hypothetical protein [Bradyrhizobium japonicum]MCP1862585.1 hypothetical protein [Bradyrhizobium japonicum]MCP1893440.1 hypothetical protein [Bradyrhizobium japonicum]MCP1964468.1 hypothetical protein [Bradyrhizobium japonicum]
MGYRVRRKLKTDQYRQLRRPYSFVVACLARDNLRNSIVMLEARIASPPEIARVA